MSESTHLPSQTPEVSSPIPAASESSAMTPDETASRPQRQEPIPPPSHPKQYRAIGLVRGIYTPSEDQLSKGNIVTDEGEEIEAVLLGRVISLIKNHLDLSTEHLWVVYPRTRQVDDHLHLQIVGVWEPENLTPENEIDSDSEETAIATSQEAEAGYFSIRGQVIFYDRENEKIIVKIRQSPKKPEEKPKFFKVKLSGKLSDRPMNRFWDLHVQLEKNALMVKESNDLGFVNRRKPISRKPIRVNKFDGAAKPERFAAAPPIPKPKPIKPQKISE